MRPDPIIELPPQEMTMTSAHDVTYDLLRRDEDAVARYAFS